MRSKIFLSFYLSSQTLFAGPLPVGPDYKRPSTDLPQTYKAEELGNWKQGEPSDHLPKGQWWQVFNDAELNALEAKAMESNQDLKAAFAVVNQSRSTARIARSDFFPTIDANPGLRRERFSPNQEPDFGAFTANTYRVPLDLSYEIDLWGRVRRGFESARAEAAASVAAFHNVLLTLQADLAQNYFSLRAMDAEITLVKRAIELRADQLGIVSNRFEIGLGAELDVARAKTELAGTEAELAALKRRRVELENAIAILVGENPSVFKVASNPKTDEDWNVNAPTIPPDLTSALLERRPDIAQAERLLASDNARIGIAKAAFFPAIRLTASGGYLSAEAETLFNWESRVWSIGPSVSLPIFAGGRNRANLARSRAKFEESVARYRQQILVAFADVENSLAGIHFLAEQAEAQKRALESARHARILALQGFTTGLTDYINVIDADRAALQTRRTVLQLVGQRLNATVQLVKALGGGWQAETATQSRL